MSGRSVRWLLGILLSLAVMVWVFWFARESRTGAHLSSDQPDVMKVVFFGVGYGDCAWIHTPRGRNLLLDAGPGTSGRLREHGQQIVFSTENVKFSLEDYLTNHGVSRVEAVVISHPHYDHWGGLTSLLNGQKVPVGKVYESTLTVSYAAYDDFRESLRGRGIPMVKLSTGDFVPTGDGSVRLEVFGPRQIYRGTGGDLANRSLVVKLTYGEFSILFPGDIEEEAELDALELGEALRSTVLKVSQHGNQRATSSPFLDWVRPSAAVISVATPNPFGAPHDDTLQKLIDRRIDYYRTDAEGDVVFLSNGKAWNVSTERE